MQLLEGWVTAQWPDLDRAGARLMVESVVRLSLSRIVTSTKPEDALARDLARAACRCVGFPEPAGPCTHASLQVRELGSHPKFILLGLALGLGAVLAHSAGRLLGQPLTLAVLSAAQLGVPVAAATIGTAGTPAGRRGSRRR